VWVKLGFTKLYLPQHNIAADKRVQNINDAPRIPGALRAKTLHGFPGRAVFTEEQREQ